MEEQWDLDGLAKELVTFWPTAINEERLEDCRNTNQMYDLIMEDATAFYGRREGELGEALRGTTAERLAGRTDTTAGVRTLVTTEIAGLDPIPEALALSDALSRVPLEPSTRTTWPLVNGEPLWLYTCA